MITNRVLIGCAYPYADPHLQMATLLHIQCGVGRAHLGRPTAQPQLALQALGCVHHPYKCACVYAASKGTALYGSQGNQVQAPGL